VAVMDCKSPATPRRGHLGARWRGENPLGRERCGSTGGDFGNLARCALAGGSADGTTVGAYTNPRRPNRRRRGIVQTFEVMRALCADVAHQGYPPGRSGSFTRRDLRDWGNRGQTDHGTIAPAFTGTGWEGRGSRPVVIRPLATRPDL